MNGRFISFEGPEGSGKSTQARRLVERLERLGLRVQYTREPGGTPTGEAIREILQYNQAGEPIVPEAEVLLFAASRAQLVRTRIRPALERGEWIVCDRFADSTTAYQGYGRGLPMAAIQALHQFAIGETWPDRTFLLDIDVETGFARLTGRQSRLGTRPDRLEQETREFHERVRRGYLELARLEPTRFRVLDAAAPPDRIADEIWQDLQDGFLR